MKHLALRARSVNSDSAYTATGLGDRIHSCVLAWVYSQAHDTPVTIHLTGDKWVGGQFANKPESWAEIVSLFPQGSIEVMPHLFVPKTENEWLDYLSKYDPIAYRYSDYPGKRETPGIDISKYLKRIPLLKAEKTVELPAKFYTAQWDATGKARRVETRPIQSALIVGGEAQEPFRWSLKNIAYAMSKAEGHHGVDSAFLHLARLYMPWEMIHVYSNLTKPGHHVLRAVDNGARLN